MVLNCILWCLKFIKMIKNNIQIASHFASVIEGVF